MSYILDALRRADSERERGAVPGIHALPLPAPSADEFVRRTPWPWLVAALLLVLLLLLFLLLLLLLAATAAAAAAEAVMLLAVLGQLVLDDGGVVLVLLRLFPVRGIHHVKVVVAREEHPLAVG